MDTGRECAAQSRDIDKSGGIFRKRCAVRYAWIDTQREVYPLPLMCGVLMVSISGFRAWKREGSPDAQEID